MKSPAELKIVLRRQWEKAILREARLLRTVSAWPIQLTIGRPSPRRMSHALDEVKQHIQAWRQVRVGQVVWEPIRYRVTSTAVDIPIAWKLSKPTEWIEATGDSSIRHEFQSMAMLVEHTPCEFHSLFIRRRALWLGKTLAEVLQASRLAKALAPGCANGLPLRMISLEGIDTKFFERNARLVTALLDVRFEGEVSVIGLENFLGALQESEHWLLVVDLDGSLLPFKKMRIRSSELKDVALPGARLLIIENESCQHCLPEAEDTIAVLGSGFDLSWTEGQWLTTKKVAYWGDIDTWGLQFLSKARAAVADLDALLMTEEVFDEFIHAAVREPIVAGTMVPERLNTKEALLYGRLLQQSIGRLEQEFLPQSFVQQRILGWVSSSDKPQCQV